jgi:hypothetical protein
MVRLAHTALKRAPLTALVTALLFVFAASASAQSSVRSDAPILSIERHADQPQPEAVIRGGHTRRNATPIRDSLGTIDYRRLAMPRTNSAPPQAAVRQRSTARKVLGAAVGATAGFFGGGYLGAAIDGDCGGCDDPGLKGALIGAPIGAVTGGILGALFLF